LTVFDLNSEIKDQTLFTELSNNSSLQIEEFTQVDEHLCTLKKARTHANRLGCFSDEAVQVDCYHETKRPLETRRGSLTLMPFSTLTMPALAYVAYTHAVETGLLVPAVHDTIQFDLDKQFDSVFVLRIILLLHFINNYTRIVLRIPRAEILWKFVNAAIGRGTDVSVMLIAWNTAGYNDCIACDVVFVRRFERVGVG
jgi:hypothetical protein